MNSIRLLVLKIQTIGEIMISNHTHQEFYIFSVKNKRMKVDKVYRREIFDYFKVRKPRDRVFGTITI